MLDIETFDNARGGNVVYKALAHPLAAEKLAVLAARLRAAGPVAIYDPDGIAPALLALAPGFDVAGIYVHDTLAVGQVRAGYSCAALSDVAASKAAIVLVAMFDAASVIARIARFTPPGAVMLSLDEVKLPADMLSNGKQYLDKLNFATNFVFFRDDDHLATRLVTANYWAGYGAKQVRLWARLFGGQGDIIQDFEIDAGQSVASIVIDSRDIRRRFNLAPFTGQLFIHAIGVAGHDVVKYALDTYAVDGSGSLSCTHDANAWPAERFAGLPAPRPGEQVILWLQNSHALPMQAGTVTLDRMGAEAPVAIEGEIAAFATRAIDVAEYFPHLSWPAQLELRAGRHVVRPRYEVRQAGRSRIAHINVERADLRPDPGIKSLAPSLGRGFLLPFPILPRAAFRSVALPTPMAHSQMDMPLRLDIFAPDGRPMTQHYLGVLPRDHDCAVDMDEVLSDAALPEGGHGELVYDFRAGGAADGWLHGLFRYEARDGSHAAETSFGGHIFNTIMTWKGEPQSYNGPPPGLTTRLYLDLGDPACESFCALIYPASADWLAYSQTVLLLHDRLGSVVAEHQIAIACSGSAMVYPHALFSAEALAQAVGGYVIIRDATCRLFGYHGKRDRQGGFSFDHMFGF
ncbi:MAG: hypothetical protein B7Z78_13395 [Rhodospirillales bacterium 20-60-12]|nr:MAG: hypothetical protein B7Z78_13395 [Rhodospirillales bacterium 20-60-12]HQT67905.1 hypothetical protein [Acetobacteraceae bacterium]